MSNTELVTVAATPLSAPTSPPLEDFPRASSRPQNVVCERIIDLQTSQGLAPIDGGFAAWRLLFVAFVFEASLWGKFVLQIQSHKRS